MRQRLEATVTVEGKMISIVTDGTQFGTMVAVNGKDVDERLPPDIWRHVKGFLAAVSKWNADQRS